jgi:hypothetical protein
MYQAYRSRGIDVQARSLVRIFGEYTDMMTLISAEPKLATEFKAEEGSEGANKFWHRYLSKGKSRKRVETLDRDLGIFEFTKEFVEYERQEETMRSSTIHPSYMGAAMTSASGMSYGRGGFGVVGAVDSLSIRTLSYVFHKCLTLILRCDKSLRQSVENNSAGGDTIVDP